MGALAQVLRGLPDPNDPNLLVGPSRFDDGGVYRIGPSLAVVQTVDFFPPLVDDPFVFGQIAAANSLSDIYAMGGRPITALNILGFPDKELPIELAGEIVRGGCERVLAAGAVVLGGHSVRDSEIKFGMAVTGLVDPDRVVTNGNARPGDVLVLTKPLGTGVLTSAAKSGKIPPDALAESIASMVELNRAGCEAMLEAGVRSATDVTGFGLIGHAFEMAEASGVTLRIETTRVPLLEGALEMARAGVITRAHRSNLEHVGGRLAVEGVDETLVKLLADAQTSGGLLISIEPAGLDALLAGLTQRCTRGPVAVVGEVVPPGSATIVLR